MVALNVSSQYGVHVIPVHRLRFVHQSYKLLLQFSLRTLP